MWKQQIILSTHASLKTYFNDQLLAEGYHANTVHVYHTYIELRAMYLIFAERSILYEKIPARAGFELQTTVSYLSTATSCCRECSEMNSCVLVTYNGGKCNLYMQNSANNDTLNCSLPQKCYLIQPLVWVTNRHGI